MGNYLKSSHQKNSNTSNNCNVNNNFKSNNSNNTNTKSKKAAESYLSVASNDSRSNPTDTTSMSNHNSVSYLNKADKDESTINNDNKKCSPTKISLNISNSKNSKNSKSKTLNSENSVNNLFRKEMSIILQPTAKQTASVIFLHGLGDTGHGWSSVFSAFKKPHIKYIFPTAPIMPVTLNGGFRMNAWFDILGLRPDANQDEDGIKKSSQILLNLVQDEIKNGISSENIYIGGFSQGGATALYTALSAPMKFAGVIALSTWLPLHHRFPQELAQVDNKFKTPIIQCHGDSDSVVPLEWSKMTVHLLKTLGFSDVAFKTYQGLGHSSTEEELDDIKDFIVKHTPQ